MFSTILENNNTYIVITSRHRCKNNILDWKIFMMFEDLYCVHVWKKNTQDPETKFWCITFIKMLAYFILLKYRLILCVSRIFKWKQKNYETRQGMQRRCNHLLYNVQFSPFYPCHINLNILKRKKLFLPIYNFAYYVISKHWFPFVFQRWKEYKQDIA